MSSNTALRGRCAIKPRSALSWTLTFSAPTMTPIDWLLFALLLFWCIFISVPCYRVFRLDKFPSVLLEYDPSEFRNIYPKPSKCLFSRLVTRLL